MAMEITEAQYERIAGSLPRQRGNVKMTNLEFINAVLYVAEQGCKWRGLPRHLGNWHTVYTRMSRWRKSGVLDRVFTRLQEEQIIQIKLEAVCLDSTIVKVHPNGTGALKKAGRRQWARAAEAGPPKFIKVAANARCALRFALSPGQAGDAPQGRRLLLKAGVPAAPAGCRLIMDRAYE